MTDHKPLLGLLEETKTIPPLALGQIQRWALALTGNAYTLLIARGAPGVMVIVVGNGHGDTSSNPGRD